MKYLLLALMLGLAACSDHIYTRPPIFTFTYLQEVSIVSGFYSGNTGVVKEDGIVWYMVHISGDTMIVKIPAENLRAL